MIAFSSLASAASEVIHANSGAKRLYVFGAKNERYFAKKVIKKLNSSEAFSLIEEFETPYDYRGNKNGIGAVFDIT